MRRYGFAQKSPEVTLNKIENDNGCHHYWKIEAANGPQSKGVCKICGAEQEFQNSAAKKKR